MPPSVVGAQSESLEPYRATAEDVAAALGTDLQQGLSDAEARRRLEREGRNELETEKPTPAWKRLARQLSNVLVILLIAAAGISAARWLLERDTALPYESIVILAIVALNAALGFVQETRAESAVAALRKLTADDATVIRDGERRQIPAAEIVPGDLMDLKEGDVVPADGRLVHAASLRIAEAALTGESVPVSKDTDPIGGDVALGDRTNMVYSGTTVAHGHGTVVVTATGMRTEMGRIAGLMSATPAERTPLQAQLDRVGKLLGAAVVVVAAVMILTIVVVERVRGVSALLDVLIIGVALAVAAVPEGLPALVTAVLALGVQRLAQRNAIVRHLTAVETLGSASVIASDKTGTLTRNEMTVRVVVTASGRADFTGTGYESEGEVKTAGGGEVTGPQHEELHWALTAASLVNDAALIRRDGRWTVQGDPTEGALLVAARKAGLDESELRERFERTGEIPFSSERKLMTTVHRQTRARVLAFTKGAPEALAPRCVRELVGGVPRPLTEERRREILGVNEALAGEAMRTLAVAMREVSEELEDPDEAPEEVERELVLLGLIGIIDPPRAEAREAVARAREAGVRTIMITGDHPRTAAVISRELGIAEDERVLTGADLERLSDEKLARAVREVSVYARVNPAHKIRIVRALKSEEGGGATVAMTGDGVNDAPALKAADIGVAMGIAGTDVAKQAADVILADDNYATIVAAVEGGREVYANIRKFLRYLLSSNIGEVMTMFLGVLLARVIGLYGHGEGAEGSEGGGELVLPLLATHILWINLVTDGPPALALGIDPAGPDVMRRPPRPRGEPILTGRMWVRICWVGAVMAAGTLLVLDASLPRGLIEGSGSMAYAQTMAFTTLMFFQLFNVLNARGETVSAFNGLFRNGWLWGAVGASLALHAAVVHVPALQTAFSTTDLDFRDWLVCAAVASSVLWLVELVKAVRRTVEGEAR